MDAFFFWLFAAGMIGFSLAVVLGRNPVACALCFATSMVFMASLFVMLNAFFLAAVQILVTAGAVMVLFLFIIMLLDIGAVSHLPRQKIWMGATLLLALGFVYLLAHALDTNPRGAQTADSVPPVPAMVRQWPNVTATQLHQIATGQRPAPRPVRESNDDTHRIGRVLFTKYVAPFEVTSLLILVATIGVVVLCKEEPVSRRQPEKEVKEPEAEPRPRTGPALTATR
jgi:NADH-quinone oxidoreductase subunit J